MSPSPSIAAMIDIPALKPALSVTLFLDEDGVLNGDGVLDEDGLSVDDGVLVGALDVELPVL